MVFSRVYYVERLDYRNKSHNNLWSRESSLDKSYNLRNRDRSLPNYRNYYDRSSRDISKDRNYNNWCLRYLRNDYSRKKCNETFIDLNTAGKIVKMDSQGLEFVNQIFIK